MKIVNLAGKNKLLTLIIAITILKGLIWSFIVPIFQAPDEHRHYATIQYYSEPKNYQPNSYGFPLEDFDFFNIKTHNLSPELRNLLEKTEFENTCFNADGKNDFSADSNFGLDENQIRSVNLPRFVEQYPPYKINYSPLYYSVGSFLENFLAKKNTNIIERAFAIRLISVFMYSLLILTAYFIFKELYFNKLESLLLAAIVSFHPMFTFLGSIINVDILLFLSFALFILGAMNLIRKAPNSKNICLMLGSVILGVNTKPTGIFLLLSLPALFIAYGLSRRGFKSLSRYLLKRKVEILVGALVFVSAFLITARFTHLQHYLKMAPLEKIVEYIRYQCRFPIFLDRSFSYWGNFGSLNVPISKYYIYIIWLILAISFAGLVRYVIYAIKNYESMKNKKLLFQILFLLYMLAGYNIMIHFINLLQSNPDNFADLLASIGTQGRYFFTTLIAKFALIAFGLSYFFRKIKREKILFYLLIAMIAFNMAAIFNFIIPRYYL